MQVSYDGLQTDCCTLNSRHSVLWHQACIVRPALSWGCERCLACSGMIPQQADRGGSPQTEPRGSRPVCVLAAYGHIASPGLGLNSFNCLIEYAVHPDDTDRIKAASLLDACACSRHIILEVAPRVCQAVGQSRGQELAPLHAQDDDSSASEHCHMPAEEDAAAVHQGTKGTTNCLTCKQTALQSG